MKSSKEKEKSSSKQDESGRCEKCGSQLAEGVVFCPSCGSKVTRPPKPEETSQRFCSKCGQAIEEDATFCPECGANVFTGADSEYNQINEDNRSFIEKINYNVIVLPTIVSLVVAIILSLIGLFVGFSWFSFILAVILSVGFFAGTIDNEANATISGLIVGIILGIIENPLVEFMFGAFAAGFYEGFFGGHLLVLTVISVIVGYVSNRYLKEYIINIAEKIGIPWI